MTHPEFTEKQIARFWSKVDQSDGPNACWPWMAGRFEEGYGAFGHNYKTLKASRVAFFLTHGYWPENALHSCEGGGNAWCCNPAHIYDGTHAENTRDMVVSGRVCRTPGEERWTSKLTDDQVMEIRTRYANGETQQALADVFDISFQNAHLIVRGKSWAHLPLVVSKRQHNQPIDASVISAIKRRYNEGGFTMHAVAIEFGVSTSTVHRIVRSHH